MKDHEEANRLTRRRVLQQAAMGVMTAAAGTAVAGRDNTASAAAIGAKAWLDMDQKQLDDAYTQSVYAANLEQLVARYASNSAVTRARLGPPRRFVYGAGAVEGLDIFATGNTSAPVQIFIHGGGWRSGTAASYAFPAEMFVAAGAHWVVPDFSPVQDTGDSLLPLADQVRRAVAWVCRNAETFGGDPERVFVSGHSSGGHLAGVLLTTDWAGQFGLPADVIKGGLCCSGMFDLDPVRRSARSKYIAFTDDMVEALSPQRHIERINAPVMVACGTLESPEFQRQSREFAAAVAAAGKPVEHLVAEGYNHFEILETLANPYGLLGHAALRQMGLEPRA